MASYSNLSDKGKEDLRLVLLARDGDQKAYAKLMTRYRDAIYFMLLKMVNNRDDADDLTIEAFGKAFKNIHQYSPEYAFSTWLFKIATNNCIDYLRKKRGILISIDTDPQESNRAPVVLDSGLRTPEEELVRSQKAKELKTVVSTLKPRYRQLIELRYFKEYSYEEISDELSLPLGTVKAQLFRARELLYNILKHTDIKH